MISSTQKSEMTSYFTEPGNGWTIKGTNHLDSEGHSSALKAARFAGFGSLVVDVVAGECTECLKMLDPVVTSS